MSQDASKFTEELTDVSTEKHLVYVTPAMKKKMDEAEKWYRKHFTSRTVARVAKPSARPASLPNT